MWTLLEVYNEIEPHIQKKRYIFLREHADDVRIRLFR